MSVTTVTCTTYNLGVGPFRHGGENILYGQIVLGPQTVSDIVWLCRVPNRAVITDIWFRGSTAETAAIFKAGIAAGSTGTETTFGTLTLSTGGSLLLRPGTGVPFKVSRSDTDAAAGATVYLTISSATWTTTATMDFMVRYTHPGNINYP